MNLSHRIALDPTADQVAYFTRASGTKRFTWNQALDAWEVKFAAASAAAKAASAEAIASGMSDLATKAAVKNAVDTAGGWPSGASLKAKWNEHKYQDFPWLKDVHRDAHSQPFADLQAAFARYRKGLSGRPKFKKKGRSRDSFYVANDRLQLDGKKVRLPVVGWVRMTEKLRFEGKVLSATVSRTADRWFVSFCVETTDPRPMKLKSDGTPRRSASVLPDEQKHAAVGVDLGILHAAVTSAGVVYDAPKPLKKVIGKMRRIQRSQSRRIAAGSTSFPNYKRYRSENWKKANLLLMRLHARVARVRLDFTHKLVTDLCRENQALGVEDLNVSGLSKNRSLSRSLSDVGLGEIRQQLGYKPEIYGTRLVVADRFYPSSKTCSSCETVKVELPLSERKFACEACGVTLDRDLNAAVNLEKLTYPGLQGNLRLRTGRKGLPSQDGSQPSLVEAGTMHTSCAIESRRSCPAS